MLKIITMAIGVLGAPPSTGKSPDLSRAVCKPGVTKVRAVIVKMGVERMPRRRVVARQLAPAILRESKRWYMHPATLLAIASTESDFRAALRGKLRPGSRRSAEVGVYQLIPGDTPIRRTRRWIDKVCRGPNQLAHMCPRDIWRRKRRRGRFTVRQLGDPVIGTYLVASEVMQHVNSCTQRRSRGHLTWWVRRWAKRHAVALSQVRWLSRVAHYNTGPRWRSSPARLRKFRWYTRRLFRRWAKIRRLLGCVPPARKVFRVAVKQQR